MKTEAKIHLSLTAVWAVAIIPTVVWFSDSVLWVGLLSVYALVASHAAAFAASRAGVQDGTLRQIRALTDALADFMEVYQNDQPDDALAAAIEELRDSLGE